MADCANKKGTAIASVSVGKGLGLANISELKGLGIAASGSSGTISSAMLQCWYCNTHNTTYEDILGWDYISGQTVILTDATIAYPMAEPAYSGCGPTLLCDPIDVDTWHDHSSSWGNMKALNADGIALFQSYLDGEVDDKISIGFRFDKDYNDIPNSGRDYVGFWTMLRVRCIMDDSSVRYFGYIENYDNDNKTIFTNGFKTWDQVHDQVVGSSCTNHASDVIHTSLFLSSASTNPTTQRHLSRTFCTWVVQD